MFYWLTLNLPNIHAENNLQLLFLSLVYKGLINLSFALLIKYLRFFSSTSKTSYIVLQCLNFYLENNKKNYEDLHFSYICLFSPAYFLQGIFILCFFFFFLHQNHFFFFF